jgi:two-component system sensor histidine kinase HydH
MIHVAKKRLYVPALSILAIVVILLVLISISTYRNLDRQKSMAMEFLHRQGMAILDAVEAGARAGLAMHVWQEDSIETLINEVGNNENIAYIYMVDKNGKISHHSNLNEFEQMGLVPDSRYSDGLSSKIQKLKNGERIYELSKQFTLSTTSTHHVMMRNMVSANHSNHLQEHIVLGLKMAYFQVARKADTHHAMMMAGIVIALGSASIFFTFIIQNYYLVEKTLRQTQDYTSQVISSLSTGIISIDKKFDITAYNEKALDLLGIENSRIKDIKLSEFIDYSRLGVNRTLSTGTAILDKEINFKIDENKSIPLSFSVTPLTIQTGRWDGAVIQIRDLSEIKRLEALVRRSEKLAAVGELAGGIAHEIRNPLSSIRGFTQFLGRHFDPGSSEKECSNIAIKEIDRINNVVSDLIRFANPMETEPHSVDVNELINHTIRLTENDAVTKQIEVIASLDSDLPKIDLDEGLVKQAFLNILLNAIQAIGSDGTIEFRTAKTKDGKNIKIILEDDGPGVSEDVKGRIFDPYFTTYESGTGLGLPIVHKIVENHQGNIQIVSPLPNGTSGCSVVIEFPIEKNS